MTETTKPCKYLCTRGATRGQPCNIHTTDEYCAKHNPEAIAKHRESMKDYNKKNRENKQNDKPEDKTAKIRSKISMAKWMDKKSGLFNQENKYVDIEWFIKKASEQEYKCHMCKEPMKFKNYDVYDKKQVSIDRLNNTLGHAQGNCVLSCMHCNNSRVATRRSKNTLNNKLEMFLDKLEI